MPINKDVNFLTGRLFARNAAFNLAGELAAFCVGIICIPYVIRKLGTDAFGILSIAWAVTGYMSLFDLGLSRATTKFVAEVVGNGDHQKVPSLVWTSIILQLALGVVGAALLASNAHLLATKILKIPVPLIAEATRCFLFLAIAVPMVLVNNCLRGVMEAMQRFDLINYIKVLTNLLMFSSPFLLIPFGGRLSSIILLMTFLRFVAMLAYLQFCLPLLRKRGQRFILERQVLARLVRYGGWVTVSNLAGPLLIYADRFAIGAILSVAALAYYSGPADMVNRTLVIPASLGSTLFPAFSSLAAVGAAERIEDIYARSLKYLVIVMGPPLLLVAAFSRDILYLWLGPAFAAKSTVPLQILALAIFISSFAIFPYGLLQGVGRPDLTAIFHLLELPLHLVLVWMLVSRMGITGAAIAVTVRVLIDTALIFWACDRLRLASLRAVHARGVTKSILGLLLTSVVMFALVACGGSLTYRVALASLLLLCYLIVQWYGSFDGRDREFLLSTTLEFRVSLARLLGRGPERYVLPNPAKTQEGE
jgi:O-antigen/teichoic acid export membrane protein